MKKATTLLAFLVAMSGAATAASLTITAAEDTSFNLGGTLLGSTFSVTGGWYDVGQGLDFASISAGFISAGSVAFPYGGDANFNGYVSGVTPLFDSTVLGLGDKNIMWFVTDGSTGYALLEDTVNTFKPEAAIPNTSTTVMNSGLYGTFTQHATDPSSSVASIGLIPIPEPSAALLGALGALGLLRRRRI